MGDQKRDLAEAKVGKTEKRQQPTHWALLSDEQLLARELTTDDPEALPGVVYELPAGYEDAYVEFAYDFRGSDHEELHCLHGNHGHKAGFVMRVGEKRFLVGHICAKTIYGENFEHYTADYDAAVNRRDALNLVREIKAAIDPLFKWLDDVSASAVFKHYGRVCGKFREHMPWVYQNLEAMAAMSYHHFRVSIPPKVFSCETDPRGAFNRLTADASATALLLVRDVEKAAEKLVQIKRGMTLMLNRIEAVLFDLSQLETLFQPEVLDVICQFANQNDNPKKRKYEYGLMSITCRSDRERVTIELPPDYAIPSWHALEPFRAALSGVRV